MKNKPKHPVGMFKTMKTFAKHGGLNSAKHDKNHYYRVKIEFWFGRVYLYKSKLELLGPTTLGQRKIKAQTFQERWEAIENAELTMGLSDKHRLNDYVFENYFFAWRYFRLCSRPITKRSKDV